MKGLYLKDRSFNKREFYQLDNDFIIGIEYGSYGSRVARVEKNEVVWCACNGIKTLPSAFKWVLDWQQPIAPGHWQLIFVPQFSRVHEGE